MSNKKEDKKESKIREYPKKKGTPFGKPNTICQAYHHSFTKEELEIMKKSKVVKDE